MAFVTADRVQDISTTTGTGSITVSGAAPSGFRTFSAVLSVGDTFYYAIQNPSAGEWETGLGTYSSANTFARTTVYASSNSNAAVNFSAGVKDVFLTFLASRTVQVDGAGSPTNGVGTGGGSAISVSDEGTLLTSGVTSVNFTGAGVTATNSGAAVTVNISGGSGGGGSGSYTRTSITATAGQTSFSASYTAGYVQVYLNGVLLNAADYTATSGTAIVLAAAATAGDIVEVVSWSVAFAAGTLAWQGVQTTSFTAIANNAYPVNTTSAPVTVTLPASPTAGSVVLVSDYAGTAPYNPITIAPNGSNLNGTTTSFVLNSRRASTSFVYIDATQGWVPYFGAVFPVVPSYTASYLVVAGGGGGGFYGGGGGAGGMLQGTMTLYANTTYSAVVGAGGAGGYAATSNATAKGANGGDSTLAGVVTTAVGGGGGGSDETPTAYTGQPSSGGSGGGGLASPTSSQALGASGTSGQGNAGGNGGTGTVSTNACAGGGGAGAAGSNVGASNNGSAGGAGATSAVTGATLTYAGGGGGGGYSAGTGGAGGSGGGGAGGSGGSPGTAGTANTGGGGGGGSRLAPNSYAGGAGGSGVVILSVPTMYFTGLVSGSPTITTNGSNTIIKFTSSGSYLA